MQTVSFQNRNIYFFNTDFILFSFPSLSSSSLPSCRNENITAGMSVWYHLQKKIFFKFFMFFCRHCRSCIVFISHLKHYCSSYMTYHDNITKQWKLNSLTQFVLLEYTKKDVFRRFSLWGRDLMVFETSAILILSQLSFKDTGYIWDQGLKTNFAQR